VWIGGGGRCDPILKEARPETVAESKEPAKPPPDVGGLNLRFAEALYADYLNDPLSVSPDWRRYFESLGGGAPARGAARLRPTFRRRSLFNPGGNGHLAGNGAKSRAPAEDAVLQHRVDKMVRSYRVRGHLQSKIDPLERPRPPVPELQPEFYGIEEADYDRTVSPQTIYGPTHLTVRSLIERLHNTYCRSIGVQYMHIDDLTIKEWLMRRVEESENRIELTREQQIRILEKLTNASVFEEFVQKKFVGAKSFSLEGAESLIPLLDLAIEEAGDAGIGEIVLAMAHRGRLNVLSNVMGKAPSRIFREFEDADPELNIGRGDVKYHMGYSNEYVTATGKQVHLSLCFNPSHLEFVNPVAVGRVRAKQDRNGNREECMCLLIHGDAAFVGEGVVQETLNLSQLGAYSIGGTVHVVLNNQIGFTTDPEQGRSTPYATAVAKMLQSPIFHVNGEDPEAVAQVVQLAMGFRREFKRDVVIDMYCYRRRGHNEGDEPSFTQPLLYKAIRKRQTVRESYLEHLMRLEGLSAAEAREIEERCREFLESEFKTARTDGLKAHCEVPEGIWAGYHGGEEAQLRPSPTGYDREQLCRLLEQLTRLPKGFHPHPKLKRFLETRRAMARGETPLDWSAAEALAFATIATDGHRIRMSGQDSERGTFSHRHSVFHDYETGERYMPLRHLGKDQAPVEIYNSPLSETGVLGFEYGYSLDTPGGLVIWEAQFGDFCNAAQVIIDQFITSAEDKWFRLSGIVLLLPHGFEGLGPEHSSARLERFLMLSADSNIQVVNPTTPAQFFHVLRRQMISRWRKPLVVMTPKSLLRHAECVSTLEDLADGRFQRIIPDPPGEKSEVERILLCSGKIYYELAEKRRQLDRNDVAILRIEQLYPLPDEVLSRALAPYRDGTPVYWVQEEPRNMGAWQYIRVRFGETMLGRCRLSGIFRDESSSPATGSMSSHKLEQMRLIDQAFGEG
jgi:2-oxoglutarate dehydrogenase E1 component